MPDPMTMRGRDLTALADAKFETDCMFLDLQDAIAAKGVEKLAPHLNEAIRRHAMIAHHLRSALTSVARAQRVLSMAYPNNLGGGVGLDCDPSEPATASPTDRQP